MAEERLGASFSIDVTDLKAGLAQANRLIRESNSEFKAAAAGLDDWTQSQEGLEARIKHLNTVQDVQKAKVEALKKQYKEAGYASNDMSAAAVQLRTKINDEQAALNKTQKELKEQKKSLENLENASDGAGESLKKTGKSAEKAADGFTVAKGAVAGFISNGLSALTGACKNAISSILGLSESTKEYRTEMAKLDSAFSTSGLSAKSAEKSYNDLYGVLGDTGKATEASMLIAQIAKDEQDVNKYTRILTGVFAKYGDSIPTEGLAEAIQATAEMGSVQGVLADALEWQGINLDEYNEKLASKTTAEERAAYTQDVLAGIYGKSADAYRENNKNIIEANEAQANYEKTLGALGDKLEPITTKIKQGFTKILEKVLELTEGVDLEAFAGKIDIAFDKFVNDIIPKIVEGLQWIKDNKDYIIAGVSGIGAAFVAWKAFSIITAVTKAIKGMTIAQAALNVVMNMNPIGLIVTAIGLLVAAFVLLWRKCDGFRNFWKGLWGGMKDMFKGFVNGVISGMNFLIRGLNKVKFNVPDWVPAIGGKNFGINLKEIPMLAQGGVVKKATTAVIGEDGAEAVVPLEKNKQWIKAVADELSSQNKQNVVINQTNNYSQAHSRLELYKSKQATAAAVKLAIGRT